MTNPANQDEVVATAVFAASLTLLAILIGVVGVLGGVLGDSQIPSWTKSWELGLTWGAVILGAVNAWCAFWALARLNRKTARTDLFLFPMYVQPILVALGLLAWAIRFSSN